VSFIDGESRHQVSLLPPCVDDYVGPEALVRVVDAFVAGLELAELGFNRVVAAATGRPGYQPGDMLRLYIWGYLNQVRSSRHLERACVRDLEAMWLMRRLTPDYRTIAAFRHDNPEGIIAASAAFVQFCREQGLVGGRVVALDGSKMRAVASAKNIAGAERLARDIAHTEKEIAYYLDRLDIIDETAARGFDDQPLHREGFKAAIASLERRKGRLVKRQQELERRDEKVLVFGELEAKPMGYGRAPKTPSYNLQSVVDVESGLIVHHDVYNDANDSHLLHPMAMGAKDVLEIDQIQVLTDGGYSNAEEIARCEQEGIEVAAPIKRGAMNSEHFRPAQFIYDEASDTIRCPAGKTLRPSGVHTRNRAIRYRTSACAKCSLKPQCTPGVQRTIHRLIDQSALDRMEARIHADPSLMTIRRCTVEHPSGRSNGCRAAEDS
jgi:transposase